MIETLSRWLNIREHERQSVIYFSLLALLTGVGFALGSVSADTLFFKRYGTDYLPVMYVVLGGALVFVSLFYAAYADRLASERLAVIVMSMVSVLLVVCWWLIADGDTPEAYPVYFLLYKLSSELLEVHLALYLSQNFDSQQSKRIFPVLFGAMESGRVFGSALLAAIAKPIGIGNVPLLWFFIIAASLVLVVRHHRHVGVSPFFRPPPHRHAPIRTAIEQIVQGAHFARGSDMVRAQAGALFFLVICFYVLSYAISRIVTSHFASEEDLGMFIGVLTAATAAMSLLVQFLITGRLLERFGLRSVNLVFPVANVLSHLVLYFSYALPSAVIASFTRDTIMPCFRNPTRDLLLNVLPDYMQGRVRALLIGLVFPAALLVCGIGLYWLQHTPPIETYLLVGFIASAALFYFSIRSNRAYLGSILTTLRERLFLPGRQLDAVLQGAGSELTEEMQRGLNDSDDDVCLAYAKLFVQRDPVSAPEMIAKRMVVTGPPLRDRLLGLIETAAIPSIAAMLWESMANADAHYRASLYRRLIDARDERALNEIPVLIADAHPRMRAVGLYGALSTESDARKGEAQARLRLMLRSKTDSEIFSALDVLRTIRDGSCRDCIESILSHPNPRVVAAALAMISGWPVADFIWHAAVERLLDHADPEVHRAALGAISFLPATKIEARLYAEFEGGREDVQRAAVSAWKSALDQARVSNQALIDRLIRHQGSPRQRGVALQILLQHGLPIHDLDTILNSLLDDFDYMIDLRGRVRGAPAESRTVALELLQIVLDERCHQVAELILAALEGTEDRGAVGIIRLGILSQDRRLRANTLDALNELHRRNVAARLLSYLQTPATVPGGTAGQTVNLDRGAILECVARADTWLSNCAKQVVAAYG